MEQTAENDNRLAPDWALRGPDADRAAWLDYDDGACRQSFNLGDAHQVHLAFSDWFAAIDYGALRAEEIPDVAWHIVEEDGRATLCWRGTEGPPKPLVLGLRADVVDRFMDFICATDCE